MDHFKFACPVCGQHISCEPDKAGSQMECPTCFQMLVVPQAPTGERSKFILTAAKVQTRVIPQLQEQVRSKQAKKAFPFALVVLGLLVVGAIASGIVFREKIFKPTARENSTVKTSAAKASQPADSTQPATNFANLPADSNWTLDLTNAAIPAANISGKINGRAFDCERAVLTGGKLDLRQGPKWPPDVGLTIYLHAQRSEDLAGKTVVIPPGMENAPEIKLRWKDEQQEQQTKSVRSGYALRLEFGPAADKHITGKIYLCTPDDAKSWVAGTFTADIRKPKSQ